MGKKGDKSWITWVGSDPQPILNSERADLPKTSVTWELSESSDQAWKSGVKTAVERIHNNGLDKVVLARDVVGTSENAIDARSILKTLAAEYPSTWNFSVAGLVGATPELLLRLTKSMVTSRVLAGTISTVSYTHLTLPTSDLV